MSNSKAVTEIKSLLEDAYGLGKIDAIQSISTDEEEFLSKSEGLQESTQTQALRSAFKVITNTGNYFLKQIGSWVNDEHLARVEHFIRYTEESGLLLAPAVISTIDGKDHVKTGKDRFALFDFIEQEERKNWMCSPVSPEQCRQAGELLSRMHKASATYEYYRQKHPEFPTNQWSASVYPQFQVGWKHLLNKVSTNDSDALSALRNAKPQLDERLGTALDLVIAAESDYADAGLKHLVHGDFHPGNILFAREMKSTSQAWLIDFDHMHDDVEHFDLGYALIMFCRTHTDCGSVLDQNLVSSFLEGYLQKWYELQIKHDHFVHPESYPELKKRIIKGTRSDLLPQHLIISCCLIIDWAVDRLSNCPDDFCRIYEKIVADMLNLLASEQFESVGELFALKLKEYLG